MGFRKIIVALDRSGQAEIVFAQALSIATESQLLLFSCLDWQTEELNPWIGIGTLADVNGYGDWYRKKHQSLEKEIEQTKEWLETYRQQAIAKNIMVECECQIGNPSFSICDRAAQWGADLIVIGRRGYRGISELLLGSVSNYVIHHTSCSVLVVQGVSSSDLEQSVTETNTQTTS
jgi:nucleotide-binding universal stress UspA family protein